MKDLCRKGPCLVLTLVVLCVSACSSGPREIHYGSDSCAHCRMIVTDARFAAQLQTAHGKVYVFDAIECMGRFVLENEEREAISSLWVTLFPEPGRLVPVDSVLFLRSQMMRSPMGLGLAAFGGGLSPGAIVNSFGGEALDWKGVRSFIERYDAPGIPDGRQP